MYIHNVHFRGYGPLKDTKVDFRFKENEDPIPTAFVGVNGSGKTLVLSAVLDGMVFLRERIFQPGTDVAEGKLFKPLKHSIRSNNTSTFAAAVLEFQAANDTITFSEVVSSAKVEGRFDLPEFFPQPPGFQSQRFETTGFSKDTSQINHDASEAIRRTVLAYYPAGRAEMPGWLSPDAKIDFDRAAKSNDIAGYQMWRVNLVDEIAKWLLDIVLDCELYDRAQVPVSVGGQNLMAYIPSMGKNRRILNHLNQVLSDTVRNHGDGYQSARFAISERTHGGRSVQVTAKTLDGVEVVIANQLQDLSTGELMAFCLFADIIRIAEMQGWDREKIEDIRGIVLVDELDVHLHIRLQKELLPKLIGKFPKIQFIFSTHSPLLALGISEHEVEILNMPDARPIDASEFSEFGLAYDLFLEQNEKFKVSYESLKGKLASLERISVITEGKTDWKHLRHALKRFKDAGSFKDLEIDFFETPDNMGDGELKKLFGSLQKFPPNAPVICLFDRDVQRIAGEFAGNDDGFVERGKVAATCLVVPDHRASTPEICVEHLYTDDALRTPLPGTEKRLRFKYEIGFKSNKKTAFLLTVPDEQSIEIYDTDVSEISNDDGSQKGELAISKSTFVEEIALGAPGSDFDVDGFRPTFELLQKIVERFAHD